ncbi:MAG: NUDIX domain-containing protein [Clostridia bacterium]|nr:NUDIX domain-containing protein [Clostridia bacterium]
MGKDMTVACGDGFVNIRVGAIIEKNGKVLMVGNDRSDYLYSVGGRIQFGETAEQAVEREVFEETGIHMQVDRLGFVHENYFFSDIPANLGKLIYEISFFFYMKVPENFVPKCESFTEDESKEYLKWVSPNEEEKKIYPAFFIMELSRPQSDVRHFVTDERNNL